MPYFDHVTFCPIFRAFWVGKASLKRWRQIAKSNLEETIRAESRLCTFVNGDSNGDKSEDVPAKRRKLSNGNGHEGEKSPVEEDVGGAFNHDIICQHGENKPLCSFRP